MASKCARRGVFLSLFWLAGPAVLAGLQGCATPLGDTIPASLGGLPAGTPERPANPPPYPAVHDMPPARPLPILDAEQQTKLEKELTSVRDRQEGREAVKPARPKAGRAAAEDLPGDKARQQNGQ